MTADIKLLPLPEGTEAGEYMMNAILFDHSDMTSYARANVAHATAAKDAEIERLAAEVEKWDLAINGKGGWREQRDKAEVRAERLAEALRLIAAPMRPDGSWNRDREACRQIARSALRDHDKEVGNG